MDRIAPEGINWEVQSRMLLVETTERYEPGTLVDLLELLASHPAFFRPLPMLIDYRLAVRMPTEEMLRVTSARLAGFHGTIFTRIAAVAAGDVQFGVLRQVAAYNEAHGFRQEVFRDIPSALEWLEVG